MDPNNKKCEECINKTYQLSIESEILVLRHNNKVLTDQNAALLLNGNELIKHINEVEIT